MNNKQFIKSSDPETISQLKSLGFQLVDESNGFVTFLNKNTKINFDETDIDKKKITYSNILSYSDS